MESPAGHTRVMWKGYELNPTDPPRKPQNYYSKDQPKHKTGDTLALFNRRHPRFIQPATPVETLRRH